MSFCRNDGLIKKKNQPDYIHAIRYFLRDVTLVSTEFYIVIRDQSLCCVKFPLTTSIKCEGRKIELGRFDRDGE